MYLQNVKGGPPACQLSDGGNLCSEGYIPSGQTMKGLAHDWDVFFVPWYYSQAGSNCPCTCQNNVGYPIDYEDQHNCIDDGDTDNCLEVVM